MESSALVDVLSADQRIEVRSRHNVIWYYWSSNCTKGGAYQSERKCRVLLWQMCSLLTYQTSTQQTCKYPTDTHILSSNYLGQTSIGHMPRADMSIRRKANTQKRVLSYSPACLAQVQPTLSSLNKPQHIRHLSVKEESDASRIRKPDKFSYTPFSPPCFVICPKYSPRIGLFFVSSLITHRHIAVSPQLFLLSALVDVVPSLLTGGT